MAMLSIQLSPTLSPPPQLQGMLPLRRSADLREYEVLIDLYGVHQ